MHAYFVPTPPEALGKHVTLRVLFRKRLPLDFTLYGNKHEGIAFGVEIGSTPSDRTWFYAAVSFLWFAGSFAVLTSEEDEESEEDE